MGDLAASTAGDPYLSAPMAAGGFCKSQAGQDGHHWSHFDFDSEVPGLTIPRLSAHTWCPVGGLWGQRWHGTLGPGHAIARLPTVAAASSQMECPPAATVSSEVSFGGCCCEATCSA
jgi:hypothetical protein